MAHQILSKIWSRISWCVCLLAILIALVSPAAASAQNPYTIERHQEKSRKALFILAPNASSEEVLAKSRREFDVFRQIVTSYWNLDVTAIEANGYATGQISNFEVVLIASSDGQNLPTDLTKDILMTSDRKVVHFGLGGDTLLNLVSSAPVHRNHTPMKGVRYKNVTLENTFTNPNLLYGLDSSQPSAPHINIEIPLTNLENLPAAIRVKNTASKSDYLFFPFALPSYYQTTEYTIAVLDLLHTPFGDAPNYPKRALVRLEDVSGFAYAEPENSFFRASELLERKNIPFHVALIERYRNPSKKIDSSTRSHRHFNYRLQQMVGKGHATVVQHGYTHQYAQEVSAVGFEFWDSQKGAPAANDSPQYAQERLGEVNRAMQTNDLPVPDIWETPHYARGPEADRIINEHYPIRYEHILGIGSLPFPAMIDGAIYIPENLGYIEHEWKDELPAFMERFKKLQVFRNPTPSFFWHPWRETHELESLVEILHSQGYEFTDAYDLLETDSPQAGFATLQEFRTNYSGNTTYLLINVSIVAIYLILLAGTLRYSVDRYRFGKYFKLTRRFNRQLSEVQYVYDQQRKSLPTFTIFVPARNEGLVIANTIENLAQLDYPKEKYQIIIITDVRELDDDVELLTRREVDRKAEQLNAKYGFPLVSCVEVPDYYSGVYGDWTHTYEKSTKGRALNYALQIHRVPITWDKVDFIGVLDADGRLNRHILKEAAWESLHNDAKILQGPVYQVSNLSQVSLVGIMAGLELARYHLTNMIPRLLKPRKIQFLAGTNYFINRQLIEDINGWDQHALVEDAELALRVYMEKRIVAQALTLPEIEQTPATFKIYRRQRERWARGQFEILGTVLHSNLPVTAKIIFLRKILLSQFRFILDIALPLLAVFFLAQGYFREVQSWMQIASVVLIVATFFMWGIYEQTYRRIAPYSDLSQQRPAHLLLSLKLFVFMPVFMIIQVIPRLDALYNYITRKKVAWAKTERTAEQPIG